MTITVAAFRQDFPEFANTTTYSDAQVARFLALAPNFVNALRWGALTDFGVELFVAHNLALSRQAVIAGNTGLTPGSSGGVASGKSVGPVSKTYDTSVGLVDGGGNWNLTTYGTQYLYYVGLFGAGGVQL